MARITRVKAAQQRYKTVPVLDQDGQPVYREVTLRRPSKRGKTSYRQRVTIEDRNQPLPNEKCDHCHKDIEPGQSYKWMKPRSGPYGGRKRSRHASCPDWQTWEYSNSLSARIDQVLHGMDESEWGDESDVENILATTAEEIRALAEEKAEAADSIEDGFGHPTSQSEELREVADSLELWADEIESMDLPEEPSEDEWDATPEDEREYETFDEAVDAWRDALAEVIDSVHDGRPA